MPEIAKCACVGDLNGLKGFINKTASRDTRDTPKQSTIRFGALKNDAEAPILRRFGNRNLGHVVKVLFNANLLPRKETLFSAHRFLLTFIAFHPLAAVCRLPGPPKGWKKKPAYD